MREKNDMKFRLDKSVKDKERLDQELSNFKNESIRARGDLESNSVVVNRIQIQYDGARQELDILKKDREQMENDLMRTKEKCFEIEK
jgi:chromosome segregation ATPase